MLKAALNSGKVSSSDQRAVPGKEGGSGVGSGGGNGGGSGVGSGGGGQGALSLWWRWCWGCRMVIAVVCKQGRAVAAVVCVSRGTK